MGYKRRSAATGAHPRAPGVCYHARVDDLAKPDYAALANRPPLEAARAIVPLIRRESNRMHEERELTPEIVAALADARLFHMYLPRSLGGRELAPPEYLPVVEALGHADASTGWCVNQGAVFMMNSAFMDRGAAEAIWDSPRTVIANGPSPTAEARRAPGGYRLTGRWTFSSGFPHATWLAGLAHIANADGERERGARGGPVLRHLIFPKEHATRHDTWHTRGLRATGSYDFEVNDLFVPEEYSVWNYGDPVREPGPLYHYSTVILFACGFASVALGVARAGLDAFVEFAVGKLPRGDRSRLIDKQVVQAQLGQAEMRWRSGRYGLHGAVRDVWARVQANDGLELEDQIALRGAATHAIHLAKEAVDIVYEACGSDAIFEYHPLQRCFQDIHAITQHVQGRLAHYEAVGQFLLGLEPDPQWL